ncbi:MAG: Holliday junction resolvase RuvX [Rikenellaceae bacterium]
MGRILAIDYGTKRTGVAVSDPLRIIATALETVATKELERWIVAYCAKNEVDIILLGKPSQLNGAPSESWKYIEPLVGRLKKQHPTKQILLHDERFTSVLAQRTILNSGIGKMARRDKALVDKVSATIILQSFMESREFLENHN